MREIDVLKQRIVALEQQVGSLRDAPIRKAAPAALKKREEQYRRITDNMSDLVSEVDAQGYFVYASPSHHRIIGYAPEELLGRSVFDFVHPEDRDDVISKYMEGVEKRQDAQAEYRYRHKRGDYIWLDSSGRPLYGPGGDYIGSIVNSHDVTERKALEEQLRQSQKLEAIGQLAGGVAHDFNNMLQAIIGYTEIVLVSAQLSGSHRDQLLEVHKAGKRAADLTRQLLAFSRRQVLDLGPLDLNMVIGEIMKMLQRLIGENIELGFLPSKDLRTISADQGQMEQVLMNLCINARDAMPQGGKLVIETDNVTLDQHHGAQQEAAAPGQYVMLSVTDTGVGIRPDIRSKVFEPFFTTKEKGQGTGLGLATVYGIVRQHNGMIHVDSDIGKGTRFRIYLPVTETAQSRIAPKTQSRPVMGGHETILVAEDDEGIRSLTSEILRKAGYQVVLAVDGADATEQYQRCGKRIDLLLLDVVMPKKSGRVVLDEIRSVHPEIKCLFMSGYSENAVHSDFVLDQDVALIQKPFKSKGLLKAIRRELDRGE